MKAAYEQVFNGSLDQVAINGAYDPTKINRGTHSGQYDIGSGVIDKFIGPAPLNVANLGESTLAIPSAYVHPVKITDDLFWIFGSDAATAAATRRVQLWTWVPSTNTYTFVGAITLTFPVATNITVRGIRALLTNVTAGTVAVSGTAVTGSGTAFTTGISVGSRIGFGSTDPNQITTWYRITATGSATSITLATSAGTISAGTDYVIQDLMLVQATTNATATNGGLFVTKGLQYDDFTNPATSIPAATTVDKIKATYWLKDAATVTNTVAGGCAIEDAVSLTEQYVYMTDGAATTLKIFKYNFRAALTPASGAFTLTGANLVITGNQTVTGNISQSNNGRVATLDHGSGSGIPSLYIFTTTRIIRIALANIIAASTTFVSDSMSEVPPGSANTNVATGGFTSMDVADSLDKLVITSTASTGSIFVTDYYTGGQQIDRRGGCLATQLPSANRDTDSPIYIHTISANVPFIWVEAGWLFFVYTQATTANISALTAYPLAADMQFQNEVPNRIILPKIDLGSIPSKFYRVVINSTQNIGSELLGLPADMYKAQYRTSGIDDNSGSWTDIPQTGDISGVSAAANIQFAFMFRTAGTLMLPARVLSLAVIYETDDALPSQYRWNFGDFNTSNGTFAWVQATLFGVTPGAHTIDIYRADTNALVLTQASGSTTNGAFEYWNGSSWVAGLGSDTVGTRRRFVPTGSLPGSVDLYAKITVA